MNHGPRTMDHGPQLVAFISNGHGEDAIAATIIRHIPDHFGVMALPLVGDGGSFRNLPRVDVLGPTRVMPSGGFIVRNPLGLGRDLRAGLVGLVFKQWRALRACRRRVVLTVAVGDLAAVLFALALPCPRFFVGTAKTDYYRDWGERYFALERWILGRACSRVYARDALTADNLRQAGVPADFVGNPIIDELSDPQVAALPGKLANDPLVVLLPGSRADATSNWPVLLQTCKAMHDERPELVFVAALPPTLQERSLADLAVAQGWSTDSPGAVLCQGDARLHLIRGQLGALLPRARLCLGLAGTANEQAVGAGVPVLSFISTGSQYTRYFARRQQQLLGEALTVGPREPGMLARIALGLLDDDAYLQRVRAIGHDRFGEPGACRRIAEAIQLAVGARQC